MLLGLFRLEHAAAADSSIINVTPVASAFICLLTGVPARLIGVNIRAFQG